MNTHLIRSTYWRGHVGGNVSLLAAALIAAASALLAPGSAWAQGQPAETALGSLAYPAQPRKMLFTGPLARHVAFWQSADQSKWVMVLDGKADSPYDSIYVPSPSFSPHEQHFAYIATTNGKQGLVVDRAIGKLYDGINSDMITFSPDDRRLAYVAWTGKQYFQVIDGRENGPYDNVLAAHFSPDGSRVGYLANHDGKWFALIDGVESAGYGDVGTGYPQFSADGKHVAYLAFRNGKIFCTVDGKEGPLYDGIASGSLAFAPAGGRWAAIAWNGSNNYAIIDGKESPAYASVNKLAFSPDGARCAYSACKADKKWVIVTDGQESKEYDNVGSLSPLFSPDSRHVGYVAFVNNKQMVVVDGQEGPQYDNTLLNSPVFSPDGNHVAYGALTGSNWQVVLDGKAGANYSSLVNLSLTFSPDSQRLAYVVSSGTLNTMFYVLDGQDGRLYDAVGQIGFSSDSKHFIAMATVGGHDLPVIDGQDGLVYGTILPYQSPKFVADQNDRINWVAIKSSDLVADRVSFGPPSPINATPRSEAMPPATRPDQPVGPASLAPSRFDPGLRSAAEPSSGLARPPLLLAARRRVGHPSFTPPPLPPPASQPDGGSQLNATPRDDQQPRHDLALPPQLVNGDFSGKLIDGLPAGWRAADIKPACQLDDSVTHSGKPTLKITAPPGKPPLSPAQLLERLSAKDFAGKRVRFSAWIKTATDNKYSRCGIWIVAYSADGVIWGQSAEVPIEGFQQEGAADWTKHELVMDIDPHVASANVGFDLPDSGIAWLSDAKFGPVDRTVPLTFPSTLKETMVNLDFEGQPGPHGTPGDWMCEGWPAVSFALDAAAKHGGVQSARITAPAGRLPQDISLQQLVDAKPLVGDTVTFAIYLKSANLALPAAPFVEAWKEGQKWEGVEGVGGYVTARDVLASDYADEPDRRIAGTSDWKRCEAHIKVPAGAEALTVGVRLFGAGTLWVDDGEFKVTK